MAKAAHTTLRNEKVATRFGTIEVDGDGKAEVPDEMAAKIARGEYGELWSVEAKAKTVAPPPSNGEKKETKTTVPAPAAKPVVKKAAKKAVRRTRG